MRQLSAPAFVCFVTALPAVTAEPARWGSAVSGLRMSLEYSGGANAEVRVTVQNVDNKPLLLPLGALVGPRDYDFRFKLVLTLPDGRDRRVIYTDAPGAISGRVDPLVVPLVPNAGYQIGIPVAKFFVLDGGEPLDRFISRRCGIRVELDVQNAPCPLYGYPNPNMIPCWRGKVVSNVVQFPR